MWVCSTSYLQPGIRAVLPTLAQNVLGQLIRNLQVETHMVRVWKESVSNVHDKKAMHQHSSSTTMQNVRPKSCSMHGLDKRGAVSCLQWLLAQVGWHMLLLYDEHMQYIVIHVALCFSKHYPCTNVSSTIHRRSHAVRTEMQDIPSHASARHMLTKLHKEEMCVHSCDPFIVQNVNAPC